MKAVQAFWRLLLQAPRGQWLALVLLMSLVSLTDGIGIMLLVPLLAWRDPKPKPISTH